MSLLHRDEPPETGVNDVLAVEGHWLGQHFRVNVRLDSYHSGAALLLRTGGRTSELTRRREFKQASPDESSDETRSRRSGSDLLCTSLRKHALGGTLAVIHA